MRSSFTAVLCLALLAGCQAAGVGNFWEKHSIDYTDIRAAEDQFADFAELAAAAPAEEAFAALDDLFDQLKQDTVAYYLYSEWMEGAFYNLLSPCRSAALYGKSVDRIVADGVLTENDYAPYLRIDARTLVLVLDLGCPSCREALEKLGGDPQWEDVRKLAVGLGYGPHPDVPGWEFLFPENGMAVFDIGMTPVFFVVAADGTVERGYKLAL